MKKTLIVLVVGTVLSWSAQAQVWTDSFNYATGNLGTAGSSGGWSGSNVGVTVTSNSLDGTSLGLPASSGNKVTTTAGSSSGSYNQFSSGLKAGAVYYSFLLQVDSTSGLTSGGQVISGLLRAGSASSYYNDVWLHLNGSNVEIGLSKTRNGTTWYGSPLTVGTTYFIVTKYQFGPSSGDDVVSLWINPATGGTTEPAADVSFSTGSDGNSSTGIGRCYIYGGCSADLDEARISTNWADVTPSAGPPPPPPPTPTPVITNLAVTIDGLVITGTNGPANGQYDVLAAADLSTPVSGWPVLATDPFDANGNFSFIDAVTPDVLQKFYAIRVNTNAPAATPPTITTQPQDTTNLVGNTATFTVAASGTAPLFYQWYLNSSSPVSNGSSSTLTLHNIQFSDAGGYSAIVSNSAGSVTSVVAQLVVTNILAAPTITTQPQSQTVNAGQTVNFSVAASGTVPLYYQWIFNDSDPLDGQTNAVLTLSDVSLDDQGGYSVIVSNSVGVTNSLDATLTVNTNAPPDFSPIGFCNNGGTITGGAGGPTVYVGSEAELQAYSQVPPPYTIYVTNSFALTGLDTHIYSNKTVIGVGNVVLSGGGLYLYKSYNSIVRNLTIVASDSGVDGVGIHYSHNLWIDHCTVIDASDGAIDITQSSDYITISWCKFLYTSNHDHDFVNLIAASDSDNGTQYHTTFHHNWWSTLCVERMPSVRFGHVHCFNNFYDASVSGTITNDYCVRTRIGAQLLVENNWFQNVENPWEQYITGASGTQGLLFATNNNVGFLDPSYNVRWSGTHTNKDSTVVVMIPGTDSVFTPSYSYTLDNAAAVPGIVTNNAGAGAGPFAP